MKRLDIYLVNKKMVESRTKAQQLIKNGLVLVNGHVVTVASTPVADVQVEILSSNLEKFVSRAGLKLQGALEHTKLAVQNFQILDLGQSTGGFSDCLIQMGASEVLGIDVGHGQLASKLRQNKKIKTLEGVNARDLSILGENEFDLIVGDLSFISITYIIPEAFKHLRAGGHLLFLVKPQFEVGPENLDKRGVVKDASLYPIIQSKIMVEAEKAGFKILDYFSSVIDGKDGNKEFFIYCQK